jgi:hypothetical protein
MRLWRSFEQMWHPRASIVPAIMLHDDSLQHAIGPVGADRPVASGASFVCFAVMRVRLV